MGIKEEVKEIYEEMKEDLEKVRNTLINIGKLSFGYLLPLLLCSLQMY